MRYSLTGAIAVIVCMSLPVADASPSQVADKARLVLDERTVWLDIRAGQTSAHCLGILLDQSLLGITVFGNVDLIMTVAHCIIDQRQAVSVRSIHQRRQHLATSHAFVTAQPETLDLAFILVKPGIGGGAIQNLRPLRVLTNPAAGHVVAAYMTAGGGDPQFVTGTVVRKDGNFLRLEMVAARGSSGGGVVDLNGNLVGAISKGRGAVGGESAGHNVWVVSGETILEQLKRNGPFLRLRAKLLADSP